MLEIIILIAGIANFTLGYIAWQKNKKNKINIFFGVLGFTTSIWTICNFLFEIFQNEILLRSAYAFGALVPLVGLFWLLYLGQNVIKRKLIFVKIGIIFIGFFLFTMSFIPDFIVSGFYNPDRNVFELEIGRFYYLYSVLVFILIAILLFWSYLIHSRAEGIIRNQLKYILIGVWSFSLITLLVSFIFPLLGYTKIAKLDSPSSLLFVAFSAYAIIKHRLMDIRIIIRKSAVYFGALVTVMLIGLGLMMLNIRTFQNLIPAMFSGPLVLLIGVILFNPVKNLYLKTANKYFFTGLYDYQEVLETFARKISKTIF